MLLAVSPTLDDFLTPDVIIRAIIFMLLYDIEWPYMANEEWTIKQHRLQKTSEKLKKIALQKKGGNRNWGKEGGFSERGYETFH
jgi:hypothetical protein